MNHWIVAPVLIPLIAGALLLIMEGSGLAVKRVLGIGATAALIPVSLGLMVVAAISSSMLVLSGSTVSR